MVQLTKPCKIWTGALSNGYGIKRWRGRNQYVHRATWMDAHGALPKGVMVCHHCDNPPCYELEHLFRGDQDANMKDAGSKDRVPFGVEHHAAKLDPDKVRMIRASSQSNRALARELGVCERTIREVRQRLIWKRVH